MRKQLVPTCLCITRSTPAQFSHFSSDLRVNRRNQKGAHGIRWDINARVKRAVRSLRHHRQLRSMVIMDRSAIEIDVRYRIAFIQRRGIISKV
ncbi:hypothetical protein CFAL_02485 [Corynebacterium falsenii DSM 44353]|nr:hypothetical protein CFAL_02485 [Corynebacterium falsenii DSM 44353]